MKDTLRKVWHFLWEEDSLASWVANIILAYVLIQFVVYPFLGFVLSTTHPVVAVVSGSMEHPGGFDAWWQEDCPQGMQSVQYSQYGIDLETFMGFPLKHGFNKGDIIVLWNRGSIEVGDVIVFHAGRAEPIIHRVVEIDAQFYKTKGDNNCGSAPFEERIPSERVVGKAIIRIPLLGWVKVGFMELLRMVI